MIELWIQSPGNYEIIEALVDNMDDLDFIALIPPSPDDDLVSSFTCLFKNEGDFEIIDHPNSDRPLMAGWKIAIMRHA